MLTDKAIKALKPTERQFKQGDSEGLFILVMPKGSKLWRFRYRYGGRQNDLALGEYPDTSLALAREKRSAYRKLLAAGKDPAAVHRAEKQLKKHGGETSFEAIARKWFAVRKPGWKDSHADVVLERLEKDIFPAIGSRQIGEVSSQELLALLLRIAARGAEETARRNRQVCGQIFRYAVASGLAERDVARDLDGALPASKKGRMAAVTDPKGVGALLRAIDGYDGYMPTKCALRLAPLVFVRPGELRAAEWSEMDLDGAEKEWRIPGRRMKMGETHVVPLSRQAIAVIEQLKSLTGGGRYLFPSVRTASRPMSDNTINAALRRLGYTSDEMTGHGFRTTASTLLNEQGWSPDAIERQLAHAPRNKVRAAYNRSELLGERRRMMQAWADYLDGLKAGADVVPIRRGA
jgi:integrase